MHEISRATIDRLDLSESVLVRWEKMVALGATPAENLRLVEAEILILAKYRDDDPTRVDDLTKRYGKLADSFRAKLN